MGVRQFYNCLITMSFIHATRRGQETNQRKRICLDPLHLICTTNGERGEERVGRKREVDGGEKGKRRGRKC